MVVGSLVSGKLAEEYGCHFILFIVTFWEGTLGIAAALSGSFTQLLVSRTIVGLAGSPYPLVNACISKSVDESHVNFMFSIISSILSISYVIIPFFLVLLESQLQATSICASFLVRRFGFFLATSFSLWAALLFAIIMRGRRPVICTEPSDEHDPADSLTEFDSSYFMREIPREKKPIMKVISELVKKGMLQVWLSRLFSSWCYMSIVSCIWPITESLFIEETRQYYQGLIYTMGGILPITAQLLVFNLLNKFSVDCRVSQILSILFLVVGTCLILLALRIHKLIIIPAFAAFWFGAGLLDLSSAAVVYKVSRESPAISNAVLTSFKFLSQSISPTVMNSLYPSFPATAIIQAAAAGMISACFALGTFHRGVD